MTTMNQDAVKLHNILNRSLMLLNDAGELVVRAGIRPPEATVKLLDHALGELQQVRNALYESEPALRPVVSAPVAASPAPVGPLPSVGIELYGPRRARFVLRTKHDVDLMALRLLVRWRVPNIEVSTDTIPILEVQRAQHRIVRRSAACERLVVGPVLAAATILAGTFRIVWYWKHDLHDLWVLAGVVLAAWVAGNLLDMAWSRGRLLLELLRLRRRMGR
jgi:hypothetical protein